MTGPTGVAELAQDLEFVAGQRIGSAGQILPHQFVIGGVEHDVGTSPSGR